MNRKKDKIFVTQLVENPVLTYPMSYIVSSYLKDNELFLQTLKSIHLNDFQNYNKPKNHAQIFTLLNNNLFAIYKEQYLIGYFGGRLMYLKSNGWKSLMVTEDIFDLNNWLI